MLLKISFILYVLLFARANALAAKRMRKNLGQNVYVCQPPYCRNPKRSASFSRFLHCLLIFLLRLIGKHCTCHRSAFICRRLPIPFEIRLSFRSSIIVLGLRCCCYYIHFLCCFRRNCSKAPLVRSFLSFSELSLSPNVAHHCLYLWRISYFFPQLW